MNTPARVLSFGLVGGLVWAVIAGVMNELFRSRAETLTVLTSGAMSGVAVSFILLLPLARFGRLGGRAPRHCLSTTGGFCFWGSCFGRAVVDWTSHGRNLPFYCLRIYPVPKWGGTCVVKHDFNICHLPVPTRCAYDFRAEGNPAF